MSAAHLATRHLRHHRVQSALLIVALGLLGFLPLAVHGLVGRYATDLGARAAATPLVLGARGNRFDLVLDTLYFRGAPVDPLPYREVAEINAGEEAVAVPLHARFTARGLPLVGTSPEYFERRGLRAAAGTPPLRLGEATLGAAAAADLELGPGGSLLSDQRDLYDLAASYPLKMRVVGVFAPTGGPDDAAIFVSLETAWIIDGVGHGHRDLAREGAPVQADAALRQYQEITPDNRQRFHQHGDPGEHPLTGALLFPRDQRAATVLKARINARPTVRALSPKVVVEEILGVVMKLQRFFDANHALVSLAAGLLLALIIGLSARTRRPELETLALLGASRSFVARVFVLEWLLLALGAAALAGAAAGLLFMALPGGLP